MPKLPEFIFDSHKRYKEDTNQLTAWLVETANGLGYGLEPALCMNTDSGQAPRTVPGGRLKGKARKQAPDAAASSAPSVAEYRRVFVNEFTKLARFIASSHHRIKIPSLVLKLARSAIAVRKRCAEWFKHQTTQKEEEDVSGKTHGHFIAVLEEVVQILDPLCERDATRSAAAAAATVETTEAALANPFSLLGIEETKHVEEDVVAPSSTAASRHQLVVYYTVAEDDGDVDWLAIFCFFEDLRDIRAFLRATWADYRDRKIDLITASVTTNMAFDIIRSTQEALLALHPRLDNYEKVARVLCSAACRRMGVDPSEMELVDILYLDMIDVEEFVYLPVYLLLQKFSDAIRPGMILVKPGTYALHQCRDSLSIPEKRMEDRAVLSDVMPDFIVLARLKDQEPVPVQDELTKELQKMICEKEISLLLVFGIQVYLDIQYVLGEHVSRGFEDLRSAGFQVAKSLRERKLNSPRVEFSNWLPPNEMCVENVHNFIREWILKDHLGAIKHSRSLSKSPLLPNEGYYLLTRHPFLCGMLQFRLHLEFQDLGLTLATAWGTILFVSHLYEACKHAGFLEPDSWKDMEWVMKVHDKDRMFRGRIPKNVNESFKSLCLMAGASTSYFASTSRAPKKHHSRQSTKHSPKGPSFLKENSPVSAMFRERIVHGGVALTAEAMEELLSEIGVDPQGMVSEPQTKLQKQWARSHKMTPLQFLATLRAALVAEQHMIRFDYVSLHMRCLKLLRELKVTLHEKFVQCYGEGYIENETQLSWLVGWILSSATESQTAAKLRKWRNESSSSHELLMPASQVVDSFIKREGHAECAKLEEVLQQTRQ